MINIDTWYVVYDGTVVYIPIDKGAYLTVSEDGEIVNVGASTITCFSTDGYTYRFANFGGLERRLTNVSSQWVEVPVYYTRDMHLPINTYSVPYDLINMLLSFAVVFSLLIKRLGGR